MSNDVIIWPENDMELNNRISACMPIFADRFFIFPFSFAQTAPDFESKK